MKMGNWTRFTDFYNKTFQELDIRDLKKAIKAKSDELSEMQIRKDKAEKRLTDANRDADLVKRNFRSNVFNWNVKYW